MADTTSARDAGQLTRNTIGTRSVAFNRDTARFVARRATHDDERREYANFASHHAEPRYRAPLAALYDTSRALNDEHFDGRLAEPHIAIDRTAPRSLSHRARMTGFGGQVQITLNERLVFGTNREWVVRPWRPGDALAPPAPGTERFINDLMLRETVGQAVLEAPDADPDRPPDERGYRGYGPRYVDLANRIGGAIGLAPVVARHRPTDTTSPVARFWPHCVRPARYYGDDVTERALDLARGGKTARKANADPTEGMLELILHRLDRGRVDDVRAMLRRHLDWIELLRTARLRPRRRAERGDEDVDGTPLGTVEFDRAWLDWNAGTVGNIAQCIRRDKSYWKLPILADALEDAGCGDERILRHLRERMEHGPRCWVLRMLLTLDRE